MTNPDVLQGEYIDDAFWAALFDLKRAVEKEHGEAAVPLIARWAGVKPPTVYGWLERTSTPGDWRYLWRLSARSSDEGFTEFASADVSSTMRLALFGEASTDGNLRIEINELLLIGGELVDAEGSCSGQAVLTLADDIAALADQVRAEAQRMIAPRTSRSSITNGRKVSI